MLQHKSCSLRRSRVANKLVSRGSRVGCRSVESVPGHRRSFRCLRCNADSGKEQSSPSTSTGDYPPLDDPVALVQWGGLLASPQRAAAGFAAATAIALGGNLGGITSALLSLDGGNLAHVLHLDVLVPVNGVKACLDLQRGFEFQYPAKWLADQTLAYRAAERAEAERGLDLGPVRPQRKNVMEPVAAFGPPGTTGEENISVIVAPILPGFQLQSLGTPEEAAKFLVFQTFAPPGSKLTGELLAADSNMDSTGLLYYAMEYTIQGPTWLRHNLAVFTARNGSLYTLNVQCPGSRWSQDGEMLRRAAASFQLLPL